MIDLYVTHYVTEQIPGYNDIAIDCAAGIIEATKGDALEYALHFVYWAETKRLERDLRERMTALDARVYLHKSDSSLQQSMMNRATALAKERGAEYFACFHNDIRPCPGWLRNMVSDLRAAERTYGRGNVIVIPRFLPYHWIAPHPIAFRDHAFWARLDPAIEQVVLSTDAIAAFCKQHQFHFDGRHVHAPATSHVTDDGHQLMMYGAAPTALEFDDVGCDESFKGINFGDNEWGMRAVLAGKKNLISQGFVIQHIAGLTFNNPIVRDLTYDNHQHFIDKWGMSIYREMQDGSLWTRIHREQREQRAANGLPP